MYEVIAITIGAVCAAGAIALARHIERERQLFAIALLAGSVWYLLFAVFEQHPATPWTAHLVAAAGFAVLALLGLSRSVLYVAIGWGCHIVWDYGAHAFGPVPGPWWTAPTCMGFDPVVAVYLLLRMRGYWPTASARALP